jgi:Flp pilus assembly protein TadD
VLLSENGDSTTAEGLLRGAVERFPRDPELRAALGYVLLRMKKSDDARQELETALSIDPGNYSAHHNLGVIFEDSGDRERAAKHFGMALQGRVNP